MQLDRISFDAVYSQPLSDCLIPLIDINAAGSLQRWAFLRSAGPGNGWTYLCRYHFGFLVAFTALITHRAQMIAVTSRAIYRMPSKISRKCNTVSAEACITIALQFDDRAFAGLRAQHDVDNVNPVLRSHHECCAQSKRRYEPESKRFRLTVCLINSDQFSPGSTHAR